MEKCFFLNSKMILTFFFSLSDSVKQDLNAVIVQRYLRGWYGRICFQRMLRNTSMLDIVTEAVRQGSLLGWVGYGFEGMDVEIFFTRMSMYVLSHFSVITSQ